MGELHQAPLSISSIAPPSHDPAKKADTKTRVEIDHLKEMYAIVRKGADQDIGERKDYAARIFRLVTFWLAALFYVLVASGWRGGLFHLSDRVLIALMGGTTISVIGLFVIVAKYLFPSDPSKATRRTNNSKR